MESIKSQTIWDILDQKNHQSYSQMLGDIKSSTVKAGAPRINQKGRGRGDTRSSFKDNRSQSSPKKERAHSVPGTFKSFCGKFVRVNGLLLTRTSLETFTDVLLMAKNDFLVLLSSGLEEKYNFGSDEAVCGLVIVRLVTILIYTVHNVNRESESQSYADILQRSALLQNAYTAVFEFMGHIVERCLEVRDPPSSYLLPGVLVFVEWLACHVDSASGSESGVKQANILDFSRKNSFGNDGRIKEKKTRVERMIAAGKAFANVVWVGQQVLYFDSNSKRFILGAESQSCSNFDLCNGPEALMFSDTNHALRFDRETSMIDGEDEEEVIVFKPSAADKQSDGGFPGPTPYEDLGLVATMSVGDSGVQTRSGPVVQNGLDATLKPTISIGTAACQNLQPIPPNTSGWLVEQRASMVNGLKSLGLMDNAIMMNNNIPGNSATTALPLHGLSLPFSDSGNVSAGKIYPTQVSEVVIPNKPDFHIFCGTNLDVCSLKGQSILPVNCRKNPVGRPVRHVGPPPGFTPVAPKMPDDDALGASMLDESPLMDDYSWLDGYQMPSSAKKNYWV